MAVTRRVSVILPADRWCSALENAFKWAIVERIEALGMVTEIFHDPRGTASLCAPMAWSLWGPAAAAICVAAQNDRGH